MTVLFADVAEEVPTEVASLDGIASTEEAHNTDRPARRELKKKRTPKGKPLSELTVGSSVKAVVKSVASYGAFCDLGAASDGLLHISRMSKDYVGNVADILSVGQEVDVRIISIDQQKNQIALSLLTEEEETEAKAAAASASQNKSRDNKRERRSPAGQQSSPRGPNPVLVSLVEKGFDSEKFVTGKVVSTVAFGAFVRIEANQFHESMEGDFEGLVHISALTTGRASSVADFVKVDDVVNVRVKSIDDGKVSLTMISFEDEQSESNARAEAQIERSGASDWKESLERLKKDMPVFSNSPLIVDMRKS
jgi:predicted RNA-binding protein with RPS1 domain